LSPLAIVYVYIILFELTLPEIAVLSSPVPNFIFNTGAVPFMFSLYVATIVTSCPALYIAVAGLVTFILSNYVPFFSISFSLVIPFDVFSIFSQPSAFSSNSPFSLYIYATIPLNLSIAFPVIVTF